MAAGILFFVVANIFAWFQLNSQFVWSWWSTRPLTSSLIFSIPVGLLFWHAIKNTVEASGSLWTSKLIGFGVGNIIFAMLTWFLMKESIFTAKTMTSLTLAGVIIVIQILWK
jgi:hypothetical protein